MKLAIGSFVAAALGAALAAAAPAADTHNIRAVAGQSYEGTIVGAGDTHAYLLDKLRDAPMKNEKHRKAV